MVDIPFPSDVELNKELELGVGTQHAHVCRSDGNSTCLPGQPRIALTESMQLQQYLGEEHLTPDLDTLAPKLWLVSTRIARVKMV